LNVHQQCIAHLLLGKTRPDPNDVGDVALYDAYIGEVTAAERVEILAFALSLFLLLCETTLTETRKR
jgi:hypothetical protein